MASGCVCVCVWVGGCVHVCEHVSVGVLGSLRVCLRGILLCNKLCKMHTSMLRRMGYIGL